MQLNSTVLNILAAMMTTKIIATSAYNTLTIKHLRNQTLERLMSI